MGYQLGRWKDPGDFPQEVFKVLACGEILIIDGPVEHIVEEEHAMNFVSGLDEDFRRGGILQFLGVKREEAGDDHHIVLDPMMDFLQEDFLFREEPLYFLVRGFLVGDVRIGPPRCR